MDSKEALTRKQDEMLTEHLSSVGDYHASPARTSLPSESPLYLQSPKPEQTYAPSRHTVQGHQTQQQYVQHRQDLQQSSQRQQQQQQQCSQHISPKRQHTIHHGIQIPHVNQQNGMHYSGQQHINMRSQGGAPGSAILGHVPDTQPSGQGIGRSSSMYIAPGVSSGIVRHQQTFPRPQFSRYLEHNYQELQQRQYEQYAQQARYYREANAQHDNIPYLESYGIPYQPQNYNGAHAALNARLSQPTHIQPTHIQPTHIQPTHIQPTHIQPIHQVNAQRSLHLGSLPPNHFLLSRDQLPTAPSPSVFSATQPAPVYPESSITASQSTKNPHGSNPDGSKAIESLITTDTGNIANSVSGDYVAQQSNRNSTYSAFSLGSPIASERTARPLSGIQDPTTRLPPSPTGNSHHNTSPTSPNTHTRSSSDPHWDPANNILVAQAKARAAQSSTYSRQVTLSSIPPNEEVPPMPGKTTSKTGKVRIQLTFDRPFFNAGGELSGRLEIQCSSSRSVMLSDMVIELLGYEALAKDHLAPKVFHKTVLRLQDIRHPSQAVQENIDPDSEGYWMARKGRTIFPFRLNIQDTLPNSYDSKLGQVRYIISAIALMKANHHKEVVHHTREVCIYETWTTDDIAQARRRSVKADTSKRLFMGGEGSLEMYAELTRTMVSSGGIVYVNIGIMGIKLSLWRHIAVTSMRSSIGSYPTTSGTRDQDNIKNYSEIIYKGEDFSFDDDDPRMVVLPVYIPSGIYSLRNTNFLHVQFFVQVSLMASMSKALAVELPIYITHASSWSDPPPRIPKNFVFPLHEDDPVKKNKTGVFSKRKTVSNSSQTNSSNTNIKTSPKASNSSGSGMMASSTNGVRSTTSTVPNINMKTGAGSRTAMQRPMQKDPDSPTSVLDFSQAGNLFVVNPDMSSIHTGPGSMSFKQPALVQSASAYPFPLSKPAIASASPPLDRSKPLVHIDQMPLKPMDDLKPVVEPAANALLEEERDFDMSRSVGASQNSSPKATEHDKPKTIKLGLRKKLAKLSISIPSHTSNSSSPNKNSRVSPRLPPATPRSTKSIISESPGDMTSSGSRSPKGATSLSRQSSGSSLSSLKYMFDNRSRKSSIGSTRVVAFSPGSLSPSPSVLKMTKCAPSETGSPELSTMISNGPSSLKSRASTPTSQTDKLTAGMCEDQAHQGYHHDLNRFSMTPTIPDTRFQGDVPVLEKKSHENCLESNGSTSRPSTPSPSRNERSTGQSSPKSSKSFLGSWGNMSSHFNSRVNSTTLDVNDSAKTAQEIQKEYYSEKKGEIDPCQIGGEVSENQAYRREINSMSLVSALHSSRGSQPSFYEGAKYGYQPSEHNADFSDYIGHDSVWNLEHDVAAANAGDSLQLDLDRMLIPEESRLRSPSEMTMTSEQSIEIYYSQDGSPVQHCSDLANHSLRPHLRPPPNRSLSFPYTETNCIGPRRPAISHIQCTYQSNSVTQEQREASSYIRGKNNNRAYSNPEYNVEAQRQQDLGLFSFNQHNEQLTPEIYSTPMLLQNEPVMNASIDHQSSETNAIAPQSLTPPSTSDSFLSDRLRLTPNDLDIDKHIGGHKKIAFMERSYAPTPATTFGYTEAQMYHGEQLDVSQLSVKSSPYSSQSNSQYASPVQLHREMPSTNTQQSSSSIECAECRPINMANVSQSYPIHYEEDMTYFGPIAPVVSWSSQHMPALQSPNGASAASNPLGISVDEAKKSGVEQSRTFFPSPNRTWDQPSSPLPNGAMEPFMNHVEVLTPTLDRENPCFRHDNFAPEADKFIVKKSSVHGQLRSSQEVTDVRDHSESSVSLADTKVGSEESPEPLHSSLSMIKHPGMVRVKGTFRTSPLAFEGNVMTVEASPPSPRGAQAQVYAEEEKKVE
ncbi:hypothetical protein BX616_007237 [Lobosporangium transversale]|nr:hypothetical protein BX616_007237 [Lobosporangium transversale]